MNKTAIKNFAVWARKKFISDITYKLGLLGINEKEILEPLESSTSDIKFFDIGIDEPTKISRCEISQRNSLIERIKQKEETSDYKTAFNFVVEEVAYTWFNRLIAIRFMEVNDYLPSKVRVLSSEIKGKDEPDIVTTPFETDLEFSSEEADEILKLKDENKLDKLFRTLFIKQCNKLNEVLPGLFQKIDDYTELLLNISFTDKDGVVRHLVNDIEEEDFQEAVEIIGWMYQYYNIEPKDEVFALLKKKVKITKERIPAATQLFTPKWIVKYMTENSLGRLWVEGHPNEELKSQWKYYLEEAEQEECVEIELNKIREEYKKLTPEDIKVIDPCMGSGHILVYVFDILMQIYESQGYTQRDAAQEIVKSNLYGLDIDERAYQLAYFAVMMKARQYDRRFLTREISPNLHSIKESNTLNKNHLEYFGNSLQGNEKESAKKEVEYLLEVLYDAKEYGSILNINKCNWGLLNKFVEDFNAEGQISVFSSLGLEDTQEKLKELVDVAKVMAQKYEVIITNPPYMGGSGMNKGLSEYVKKKYPDSKSDLFAVFIERCREMSRINGYYSMITQHAWMFLSSYEKLRQKLMENMTINMAHLGARAFDEIGGEVVQATAFVNNNNNLKNYKSTYVRLIDYSGEDKKEEAFLNKNDMYVKGKENFSKIPGSPIAYWVSKSVLNAFEKGVPISSLAVPKVGLQTGDNNRFLRLWYEVENDNIKFDADSVDNLKGVIEKWFPYNKGGAFRKWYGNRDNVINWSNNGYEIKSFKDSNGKLRSRPQNMKYYFREAITWSDITIDSLAARYCEKGFIFDVKGSSGFADKRFFHYIIALLNSYIFQKYIKIINPTITTQVGDISKIPFIYIYQHKNKVKKIVEDNILTSKQDWDSFETSWDFTKHPLIQNTSLLNEAYNSFKEECNSRFDQLKANEEELNRIFIDIYGLQDELTPEVKDKDVTVARIYDEKDEIPESIKGNKYVLTKEDVIKSFISYGVGCMFGRYSLDKEGLAFAGGEWDSSGYETFTPVKDNCIVITDKEYFKDDIVGLFIAFMKKVYGEENIEENLKFIAEGLNYKGETSREVIRNYFIKDFYKDHVKTYQKRPIYWLYDSGKQNGFKALIYMHRYTKDTTGETRISYVHKMQKIYTSEINRMNDIIESSENPREASKAEKEKERLIKQLKETKEYDEKIAHIALSYIDIDLDDGVKVNYEKVQTDKDGKKLNILSKI